jgi:hypothetical protein
LGYSFTEDLSNNGQNKQGTDHSNGLIHGRCEEICAEEARDFLIVCFKQQKKYLWREICTVCQSQIAVDGIDDKKDQIEYDFKMYLT